MRGWGWFFLLIFFLIVGYAGWAGYHFFTYRRANGVAPPIKSYIPFSKAGQSSTNYPSPRASNPLDWIKDQIAKLRNKRTHRGAYEGAGANNQSQGYASASNSGGPRRGRGLEDDAWDTRVGNEDPYGAAGSGPGGYYEEQEVGLEATTPAAYVNETANPYGGSEYLSQSTSYAGSQDRGRTLAGQHLSANYDAQGPSTANNPFGDQHEAASMRSVSPRPVIDTSNRYKRDNESLDSIHSSPASIRKSHFREEDMR